MSTQGFRYRPRGEAELKRRTVSMKAEVDETLVNWAKEKGISFSMLVERILESYAKKRRASAN